MKNKTHKHHIIPKHSGGGDEPENLIELTVEQHALAHLKLFEQNGNPKDYCAYKLLSGQGDKFFETASLGGKIQGAINRDSGHMNRIRLLVDEEKRIANAKKTMFERRNNCFLDPEKRRICQSKGGTIGGRKNAASGHLKRISVESAKIRSEKMKNRILINNGSETKMIPESDFDLYPGWNKGRHTEGNNKNTIWITDGNKRKRIKKDTDIPEGWSACKVDIMQVSC